MTFTMKKFAMMAGGSLISLALILGSVAALPQTSYATPAEEKQAEADAALAQLNEKQAEYDAAEEAYQTAYQAQLDAEAAVADAQQRIDEANARIAKLQSEMGTRARSMYRDGSLTIVDLLFGATSFEEFINNWDFLNILNQNDADMIAETKELKAEVEAQKVILVEQQQIATQKAQEAQAAVEQAQQIVDEQTAIYNSLSAEAAELLAEEQAAAEAAAAAAAAAAIESGSSDSGSSSSSGSYNNSYSGRADAGSTVGRAYAILNEGDCYYSWGGVGAYGFDCSGFVSWVINNCGNGWSYGRLTAEGLRGVCTYVSPNQAKPGDLIFFQGTYDTAGASHVGIYVGNGMMIHCGNPIQYTSIESSYWQQHFYCFGRLP